MPDLGALPIAERTYLSPAAVADRHGASREDLDKVREFAVGHGLMVRGIERARRILTLAGSAEDMARAFGVELERFEHPNAPYRAPSGPVRLPPKLGEIVTGVFGLDNRPQLRPHVQRNADPSAQGYALPAVAAAYEFPPMPDGSDVCVGILEFGGGYAESDLDRYFSSLGVPTPEILSVEVDGASNSPTGSPGGPDAEVELDVEIVGALVPGGRVVVYFAPNTEQGFVDALTTAIHDSVNQPSVLSISWGSPEETWSDQARAAFETAAQDAAMQGITIVGASGDQGASDGEPAGALAVDFPASSPYVMGCGGTRLELSGSAIVSEVVWNDLSSGEGATGGGVSEDFSLPTFQSSADVPRAPNGFQGRGVPDVAADADPETGYAVVIDGAPAVLGGTSAAAPLWAALLSRLGAALGKPLGYLNPLLYPSNASGTFRPITSGDNGGYSAGPGWNACTGLGSPQGTRLLAVLEGTAVVEGAIAPVPPEAAAGARSSKTTRATRRRARSEASRSPSDAISA